MTARTAEQLIGMIRYQYPLGTQTTVGPCANEDCDKPSRGSRECPDCLAQELGELTGFPELAEEFLDRTIAASMRAEEILNEARRIQ